VWQVRSGGTTLGGRYNLRGGGCADPLRRVRGETWFPMPTVKKATQYTRGKRNFYKEWGSCAGITTTTKGSKGSGKLGKPGTVRNW